VCRFVTYLWNEPRIMCRLWSNVTIWQLLSLVYNTNSWIIRSVLQLSATDRAFYISRIKFSKFRSVHLFFLYQLYLIRPVDRPSTPIFNFDHVVMLFKTLTHWTPKIMKTITNDRSEKKEKKKEMLKWKSSGTAE